jgi:hypothetical protein
MSAAEQIIVGSTGILMKIRAIQPICATKIVDA